MITQGESTPFDAALKLTLGFEGGYTNDPLDRGKATNFGVTQRAYDRWRARRGLQPMPVAKIAAGEVRDLYRDDYWVIAHCDEMPVRLALVVFDTAVNSGPTRAIILLQRALGVHPDVGIYGPQTRAAVADCDEADTVRKYLDERAAFFDDIVEDDPTQARFIKGWHNRIAMLRDAVLNSDGGTLA